MNRAIAFVLFLSGLVHLLPAAGVLGGSRLTALYGISIDDPSIELLLRHRALLFGVLGVGMVVASFVPKMRSSMLPMALASTLGFVVLGLERPLDPALARVLYVDLALSALLAAAIVAHLRSSAISSGWFGHGRSSSSSR